MWTKIKLFVLFACILLIQTSHEFDDVSSTPTTLNVGYTTQTIVTQSQSEASAETVNEQSTETSFGTSFTNDGPTTETIIQDFNENTLETNEFTDKTTQKSIETIETKSQTIAIDDSIITNVDNSLQESNENMENLCNKCQTNKVITGLHHKIKNNKLKVFWKPIDESEPGCQYTFTTQMHQDDAIVNYTHVSNITGSNVTIKNICGNHTIKIEAENYCFNKIEAELRVIIPANQFDISVLNTTSTEALIKATTSCTSTTKLTINCNDFSHIFQNLSENLLFNDLRPHTNYSCQGNLYKDDNVVGNTSFSFQTQQTALSSVRNLTIANITETSFVLNWRIPKEINGIITEYKIVITGDSLYDAPSFCANQTVIYNQTKIITNNLNKTKLSEVFENLPGNYEFVVTIKAKTIEYGPETNKTATTKTPVSKPVNNLMYTINNATKNKPKMYLSWSFPCDTYASPERIKFKIHTFENTRKSIAYERTAEVSKKEYTMDLDLNPSTNYTIMIYVFNLDTNISSEVTSLEFRSPNGVSSTPLNVTIQANTWNFNITWNKPLLIFGDFLHYQLNITEEALHPVNCESQNDYQTSIITTNETFLTSASPHRKYFIKLAVVTSEGIGDIYTNETETKRIFSKPVVGLECIENKIISNESTSMTITFQKPCDTNGEFDYYEINLKDDQGNQIIRNSSALINTINHLKFEMLYEVSVFVITKGDLRSNKETCKLQTLAGIPDPPKLNKLEVIRNVYDQQVDVLLKDDYFNDTHGEILYFAVLVGVAENWDDFGVNGKWDGSTWPNTEFWNTEGKPYQATPENWEPLKGAVKNFKFKLGTDNCTGIINKFCNGPLKANTEYYLAIRGYTRHGYQSSNTLDFVTADFEKTQNVVLIIGIAAGVLIMMILTGFGCVYWKRRPSKPISLEEANQIVHDAENVDCLPPPHNVKIEDFPAFYNERKQNLGDEYEALAKIGMDLEINVGVLMENRKKNRYINILPYDCSRVPLVGPKNDYINASYIKGYSGSVEYIATQGPLESTTADFWLMVIKENCSVVAMVAQFEEQKKTKCHRYFPECREQMEMLLDDGEEMIVRCSYALNYDYYIERQIIIQAYNKNLAVTHLQFLYWPDFGCPEGTTNMLQFTKRFRRHMEKNNSKSVVHCSAGVGRTGTLVAVDIILQTIRDSKDINIYGVVAELRRQRTKMVQAESQYLYIYQCILDEILQPMELTDKKPIDPIYENMENLIEMKEFSKQNNNCDTQIEYFNTSKPVVDIEAECDKTNDEQNNINNKKNEESITRDSQDI